MNLQTNQAPSTELRRQRLRVAVKLMMLIALAYAFVVLFSSFMTTQPGEKSYQSKQIDASSLEPGQMDLFNWNGRPVLVFRRTAKQILQLQQQADTLLQDADSASSNQPSFARDKLRSRHPEWFVAIASGTDLNCNVGWLAESDALFKGASWPGGFVDSCRGSRYDMAGRVYKGQNARRNLAVPEYLSDGQGVFNLGAQ